MFSDALFMHRAIEVALEAERVGNPPVGALITLSGDVVAEGGAAILLPTFDGTRHAEMEALRAVPAELWPSASEMCIYTTLEPCLMCFAAILIHGIGRIVFGAADNHGGAGCVRPHLPPYFHQRMEHAQWLGPIMPAECDPLYARLLAMLNKAQRGLV